MSYSTVKTKIYKKVALFLIVVILLEIAVPTASYALTSGPSQPEVQSFEPVATTEMVDLFSGDFTYNIPLFELPGPNGGYPFNLHYNSGIAMDQEASWTGLGWNLNPGAITRQMRGLPDEYDNDQVKHIEDMKPNTTYGIGVGGGLEIAGADLDVGVNLGVSFYYNNYKGVGYSIDQGISVSQDKSGIGGGLGLDVSMDSQEGVGVNASLSLIDKHDKDKQRYSLGIGFNSHSGARLSMGMTSTKENSPGSVAFTKTAKSGFGGTSTLSFHSVGYSPNVAMPMTGKNISLQYKAGVQAQVVTASGYISGFYNTQKLQNRGKEINTPAYGYLNIHKATQPTAMLDFNREGDGMVRKTTPNLPIPFMTCDVYSVSAHGVAGMYRAFRNDISLLHDPYVKSETFGGALGMEVAGGLLYEVGGDVSVNYSKSESGLWGNGLFTPATGTNKTYEPAYFKTYGEHTTDELSEMSQIGDEKAIRVKLDNLDSKSELTDLPSMPGTVLSSEREPRNTVINYIDNNPKGGIYVTNSDGSRYYYKKAENTQHIECLYASGPLKSLRDAFSSMDIKDCGPVIPIQAGSGTIPKHDYPNTNEYLKKTSMPEYAYAYLIDYILGPDYVDADGDGKVSNDDLGYWVKFNYNEALSFPDETESYTAGITYNWRVPFAGANYVKGLHTTFEDDKGSYTYGTKKVYYLTSVESKTHKAVFSTSRRSDARGAANELQNPGNSSGMPMNIPANLGAYSRKLDKIELFSKMDMTAPIKSVNFLYDYSLCKGLHNSVEGTDVGKLTLKKVWFTYQKNTRGSLNPYTFNYNESNTSENPAYNPVAYDRWGNYKPVVSDFCNYVENPYVTQFAYGTSAAAFQETVDRNMSVWNLKDITLPSGAKITVQYEADDYAYVQNKRATQMFEIISLSEANGDLSEANRDSIINHDKWAGPESRKVYFNLEQPVAIGAVTTGTSKAFMANYVEGLDKLYFKAYMYISDVADKKKDYVSGYVDISDCDIDFSSNNGAGYYTRGVITMGRPRIGKKNGGSKAQPYHPFSMAAWQYIRTDNPTMVYASTVDASPDDNKSAALEKVKSLGSIVEEVRILFKGFYDYAYKHTEGKGANKRDIHWGQSIVLGKSFIKLNSPDKKKYGGGCRVKKITLNDQWQIASTEPSSEYGQVYDYTITEGDKQISSGVASYEPAIGGDENPLKAAKEFVEAIPLKSDNKLFFEYPINESYYPSASVGYRQVTVKSLATDKENKPGGFPAGILTTGAVVHEFYTAKEFPVISEETTIDINFEDIFIPIPLVGQISSNKLTASQGYCTILNDMHGKPRKVTNYRQNAAGAIMYNAPDSYVEYLYSSDIVQVDSDPNHNYWKLNNKVTTLKSDDGRDTDRKDSKYIGQDYEFFADSRESYTVGENGGLKVNTDGLYVGTASVPLPVPWPTLSRATTRMKTIVINKIIHKSGIQIGTIAYDGGSTVKTTTVLFDDLTGVPLLTRTVNEFDDPVFNYDIPAHFAYNEAGPAYKNIGIKVTLASGIVSSSTDYNELVVGDELVSVTNSNSRLVYINYNNTHNCRKLGASSSDATTASGEFFVIRSGRRNMLDARIGNIKTLGSIVNETIGDPTINSNRKDF